MVSSKEVDSKLLRMALYFSLVLFSISFCFVFVLRQNGECNARILRRVFFGLSPDVPGLLSHL